MAWYRCKLTHKSVWCTLMSNTHMDVILWSVCYFYAYCTMCYIALFICPALSLGLKMYLVISCCIKYEKISLSLSAFSILCYAGRFIPRVSVPCIVHPANEVTPYTDWALPGDQIVASHEPSTWSRSRGYWHRAGQPRPMPEPAARRTSPIKHCQVAYTLKTYSSMSLMAIPNVHIGNITQNIPLSRYSFV